MQRMNLVWSPESASKAYLDTVNSCEKIKDFGVAELLSAMAAGWKAKLIVEVWSDGGPIATSIGLAVAASHTRARHVCIVPDERSRLSYVKAMNGVGISATEVVVRYSAEDTVARLVGVDFLVVDCRRGDFARVLRLARVSNEGAVLACKNASQSQRNCNISEFRWDRVLEMGTRVVRSVFLPVGQGLDIAHVASRGSCFGGEHAKSGRSRWIKHIDEQSGEEHVFRV